MTPKNVFFEIKDVLDDSSAVETTITFKGKKNCPAIFFESFVLIYFGKKYYVSFRISDHKIERVAYFSHVLTLIYQDDLIIYHDNFIEKKTALLHFDDAAYEKYEEYIHALNGMIQCKCCDNVIPKEMFIIEKGYCKICEEHVFPHITLH